MKVYVISDNPDYGIAAVNMVNKTGNTAIMSEMKSDDVRDLLAELRESVNSRFDMILMICHGAKDVAISANKMSNVMAVACKDVDDSMEAVTSTRANVILVDSIRLTRSNLASIIDGMLSKEEGAPARQTSRQPQRQQQQVREPVSRPMQLPEREKPQGPGLFAGIKGAFGGKSDDETPAPRSSSKPRSQPSSGRSSGKLKAEMSETVEKVKKKGVFGTLKESLGMDEEEK